MKRWDRIGRAAAYVAAAALVPYLVIKVSWVVGSLLGLLPVGRGFSLGGWLVLNLVTIGMAAGGIALRLALVRPWGMRIPGRLVGFFAWVGSGFLVSILPFVAVNALVNSGGGSSGDAGSAGSAGPRSTRLGYPLMLAPAWLGSGSMFAWSDWRLPATLYVALAHPSDVSYPENVTVAVALHVTAVLTGAGMVRTLIRTGREREVVPDRPAATA